MPRSKRKSLMFQGPDGPSAFAHGRINTGTCLILGLPIETPLGFMDWPIIVRLKSGGSENAKVQRLAQLCDAYVKGHLVESDEGGYVTAAREAANALMDDFVKSVGRVFCQPPAPQAASAPVAPAPVTGAGPSSANP